MTVLARTKGRITVATRSIRAKSFPEQNQKTYAFGSDRKSHRRSVGARFLSRFVLVAVGLVTTLGLQVPSASASTAKVALNFAEYALATATHDRPTHVVSAADVSNAVITSSTISTSLHLVFNLGDVMGYSRIIDLVDTTTFKNTCVYFPNKVGGTPKIIPCPDRALGLWNSLPAVLGASRKAVAAAASHGHAVSGADVVIAGAQRHLSMIPKPTFGAGKGNTVKFGTKVEIGKSIIFTIFICVSFPKTAYGIPTEVAC